MTVSTPLLMRRGLVLAGIENAYNQEAGLDAEADAILCEEPDYSIEPTVLERNFSTEDLSPKPHVMGRKLARVRFVTELRGNGKQHSGSPADAPLIGRLFRACGYSQTAFPKPEAGAVYEHGVHANAVRWTVDDGGLTNTGEITYFIKVTADGESDEARMAVGSDTPGEESRAEPMTAGKALALGTRGLVVTPDFDGPLVEGQTWSVSISPKGFHFDPVSQGQESVTLRVYFDGLLHKMTGAFGTFSIAADAGQYAKITWEFTGQYHAPVDAPFPSARFERTLPPMVEKARLRVDDFSAVVSAYKYDQANKISPRPDVSSPDGYLGVRITGRAPTGGIDPEAALVADQDFWGKLAEARPMPLQLRIGSQPGNTVWIKHPLAQYTGLTYRDRDGIRAYDAALRFSRYNGNDETRFVFC